MLEGTPRGKLRLRSSELFRASSEEILSRKGLGHARSSPDRSLPLRCFEKQREKRPPPEGPGARPHRGAIHRPRRRGNLGAARKSVLPCPSANAEQKGFPRSPFRRRITNGPTTLCASANVALSRRWGAMIADDAPGGALPGTHAGRRGTFERPGAIMAGDARGRNFLRSKSSTSRGPCPEPEASFLRAEKTMQSACSAWHKGFLEQDAFCRAPPAVRENAANAAKRQGKGSAPCARRNVCGTGQAPRPYEGPQPPSPPAEGEQQPRVLVRCHALDQAERHSPPENESLQKTSWENPYRLKGYLRYCPRGCLRRAPLRTRTRASRKSARDVLPGGRGSVIRRSFPMRRKVP